MAVTVTRSLSHGPGALLELIRASGPMTRRELIDRTGLGRSTVYQRVDALLASELLIQDGDGRSTGGRPAAALAFNPRAGLVLAGDFGASHSRAAVTDLSGAPLAELTQELDIAAGPEVVLGWAQDRFDELLEQHGHDPAHVRGVGVGVPGPVEFATGRPVSPPIMPGWDGVSIPDLLAREPYAPVLVDNDVNMMAIGEQRTRWPAVKNLLYVKVGTGIGLGIVVGGEIYRGEQGAAGDIGHVRVTGFDDVVCECGNVGCLEAVASGRAMARRAREQGLDVRNGRDVVSLVLAQNPQAMRLVREAGRLLGEVLAGIVNALNPGVIIIGGDLAHAEQQLFAGVRETVYKRSTPLATQQLQLVRSALGDHAGVRGAALTAIEHVLSPEAIDRQLAAAG